MSPCRPDKPANNNADEPWEDYQELRMPVGVEHWQYVNECLSAWRAEYSVPPQSNEEVLASYDLLQELLRRPGLLAQIKLRFWVGPGAAGPIRRYHGNLDDYGIGAYGSGTYGSD